MGHYDECRDGYCGVCGQSKGYCEHTDGEYELHKAWIGKDFVHCTWLDKKGVITFLDIEKKKFMKFFQDEV